MSNENIDPRMSKDIQSVAGSVFGIDLKKKHEVDFLDDFDSGFDLSAITGIPQKKVEPSVTNPGKLQNAGASVETSFSSESDVRLNKKANEIVDNPEGLDEEFSWEQEGKETVVDEFGFGLDEVEVSKPTAKKIQPKEKKKKPITQTTIESSSIPVEPMAKKELLEKSEMMEADWQAANVKPATTQAKDNFWDPLEEWSWDDNTNQPVGIVPAKQMRSTTEKQEKISKETKPKFERPSREKPEKKGRLPKEERSVIKSKKRAVEDVSYDDHDEDLPVDRFDAQDDVVGFGNLPRKTLNLNDLLEDWDHDSPPVDEDLELHEDGADDFNDEYPVRKPERSKKPTRSAGKPKRERFVEIAERAEVIDDDFSDDDFNESEFSFDEEDDEVVPVSRTRQKSEVHKPVRREDEKTREKPRSSREVKEAPAKPAKKPTNQMNIPTWEEAISIVLEANAHLMTQAPKSGSRGGSSYHGSSSSGSGEPRTSKNRGKRGPQRRRKN